MRTVVLWWALAMIVTPLKSLTPLGAARQDMTVAYVVQTITLRGGTMRMEGGHRPVRVSPASEVTAISRLEVPAGTAIALSDGQIEELAYAIADTADLPRVRDVQIDFDVTIAQRCFYRQLIHRVRELLRPDVRLSMTALASWCMDDDWISDLPLDQIVPMLRTSADWKAAAQRAKAERRQLVGPCARALQF